MKENTKKALGFYLSAVAAVLALVSVFLYGGTTHEHGAVRILLIAHAVVAVVVLGAMLVTKKSFCANLMPIVNAVLSIVAIGLAAMPMATLIVYAFIGMNEMSTIQGFLTFAVVTLVAWLLSVLAAFFGVAKKA